MAGLWAAISVPLWLAAFVGHVTLPSAFAPVTWHAREMLFGFVQAAIAGFLLTAVPNWTGRMPIQGWSLGGLVLSPSPAGLPSLSRPQRGRWRPQPLTWPSR